jgi:hypothetical protein
MYAYTYACACMGHEEKSHTVADAGWGTRGAKTMDMSIYMKI